MDYKKLADELHGCSVGAVSRALTEAHAAGVKEGEAEIPCTASLPDGVCLRAEKKAEANLKQSQYDHEQCEDENVRISGERANAIIRAEEAEAKLSKTEERLCNALGGSYHDYCRCLRLTQADELLAKMTKQLEAVAQETQDLQAKLSTAEEEGRREMAREALKKAPLGISGEFYRWLESQAKGGA